MRKLPDPKKVLKELAGVAEKLDGPRLTSEKRMALLRRQAELGDQRDQIADNARRAHNADQA